MGSGGGSMTEPKAQFSAPRVRERDGDAPAAAPGWASTRVAPPSREELVRVRDRDPEALAAFFDRYFGRIFSLAYRMLGDRTAAEDVSQEIFLKVHRAIDRLDPERDPGPWLTTIACNACREYWRGRHQKMALRSESIDEIADWEGRHPRAEGSPETELLSGERRAQVQDAIRQLPESLREVVVLHDYEGLSHQEVAVAVGTTYAAVRKRYSRAVGRLAKILKRNE
jgi:RNA polymerase sigma-70 factor (ECF subfamily)